MNEREIFLAALEINDLTERAAWVAQQCAADVEMHRRVECLLQAHVAAADFLEKPAVGGIVTAPDRPQDYLGSLIAGKYKLLQVIGEGGMGAVYMADQLQPIKRRVAVKLIKTGMDSRNVLARFESERQALALMDHPNIAKVLDAGTTGEPAALAAGFDPHHPAADAAGSPGRPFFVMELVKGIPLTEYCDQNRLSVGDRLGLFRQICSAVHHAHQKGIINRDLKPSNILVESHDGKPVPKVIDFGLAKAVSGMQLTENTLFTALGTVAGTPLYMAPEQAAFNAIDIDTRADIFALGVILYELLTGSTPITRDMLKKAAFDELLRVVREQEPPTPSKRISTSEALPTVAANRQMEPIKLGRFVRGDLDWIVMKALAKERDRRYESATAFAQDIEHFLNHEPVSAGPPTVGYKLRKFVKRNRPQVIAAGMMLGTLLIGMALAFWQAARAKAAESRAIQALDEKQDALDAERIARRRVREALDEMSSSALQDWLARQPTLSSDQRDFLERTAKFYEEFAADSRNDEESRAKIAVAHLRLAHILQMLGQGKRSAEEAERCYAVFKELASLYPSKREYRLRAIQALDARAGAMLYQKKAEEIDPLQLQAIELADQLRSEAPSDPEAISVLCRVLINRGYHLLDSTRYREGLEVMDRALPLQKQLAEQAGSGKDKQLEDLGLVHQNRAVCLAGLGQNDEALRSTHAALDTYEALARRSHRHTARYSAGSMRLNLGSAYLRKGKYAEAVTEFQKSEEWLKPLGEEYRNVPSYRSMLGSLYISWARLLTRTQNWTAANEMANRALKIWTELDYKAPAGSALIVLADCRIAAGQFTEAARDYLEAIGLIQDQVAAVGHNQWTREDLINARLGRSRALSGLKRHGEAVKEVELAMEVATPEMLPRLRAIRATKLSEAGQHAEAIAEATELTKASNWSTVEWYNFACVYAVASGKITDKKREYADRAMELLHKAIQAGWKDAAHMAKDSDLDSLRDREDFKKLMAELKKN
jgi:serine/threonine protein kinase/tetratricopeptide (TPR) repeat protein